MKATTKFEYICGFLSDYLILKKIIITGGNGFIGSHLAERLISHMNVSLVLISNTENANDKLLKEQQLQKSLPLTFYTADITDGKAILEIFKDERADTCVHLAAKISVADSIKKPKETMKTNVEGTLNVLEACYKTDVKNFLFASSAAVYGDVKELPIKENANLNPLSPYGESKMIAEKHILAYHEAKKIHNCIMLRIFNVYGKGQQNETDVISKFAGRLSKGLSPIIYGDGTQTRDFISVNDVASAFLLSIKSIDRDSHNQELQLLPVFNIGTGIPTSINQIAQKMIEIFGLELEPIHEELTGDTSGILHSYADLTRTKEAVHFVPKQNITSGLKEIIGN